MHLIPADWAAVLEPLLRFPQCADRRGRQLPRRLSEKLIGDKAYDSDPLAPA